MTFIIAYVLVWEEATGEIEVSIHPTEEEAEAIGEGKHKHTNIRWYSIRPHSLRESLYTKEKV